jgi:hypothetical protein
MYLYIDWTKISHHLKFSIRANQLEALLTQLPIAYPLASPVEYHKIQLGKVIKWKYGLQIILPNCQLNYGLL